MSEIKLPVYPQDFFHFGGGAVMSEEYINQTIKEIIDEMMEDKECRGISRSTGDTKISVDRDEETNYLIVEVYKNYYRKYIEL